MLETVLAILIVLISFFILVAPLVAAIVFAYRGDYRLCLVSVLIFVLVWVFL